MGLLLVTSVFLFAGAAMGGETTEGGRTCAGTFDFACQHTDCGILGCSTTVCGTYLNTGGGRDIPSEYSCIHI